MKKIDLIFMSIFLFSFPLFAQKTNEAPKVKFEKVSEEENEDGGLSQRYDCRSRNPL